MTSSSSPPRSPTASSRRGPPNTRRAGEFPRETIRTLGRAGLLGLPYPEEVGGGGQPYEVYLQVLEILASRWLVAAEAVSVHTLSCYPVASARQRDTAQAAARHARR